MRRVPGIYSEQRERWNEATIRWPSDDYAVCLFGVGCDRHPVVAVSVSEGDGAGVEAGCCHVHLAELFESIKRDAGWVE